MNNLLPKKNEIQSWPFVKLFMNPLVQTICKVLWWTKWTSHKGDIGKLILSSKIPKEKEQFWEYEWNVYNKLYRILIELCEKWNTSPDMRNKFPERDFPITLGEIQKILSISKYVKFDGDVVEPTNVGEWISLLQRNSPYRIDYSFDGSNYVFKLPHAPNNYLQAMQKKEERAHQELFDMLIKLQKKRHKSVAMQITFKNQEFPITLEEIESILSKSKIIATDGVGSIDPSKIYRWLKDYDIKNLQYQIDFNPATISFSIWKRNNFTEDYCLERGYYR